MNPFLESALLTAREFTRRVTGLTSHVVSRGAVYTRYARKFTQSARNPQARTLKPQAQKRETLAVEAIFTSPRDSVYATAGDRDTQSWPCNVSSLPVRTGSKPLSEAAATSNCTSAFNFKSLEELSCGLVTTLQNIKIDPGTVKEGATGNDKLPSANGPNDLNRKNDECIESASDIELCISILTETASVLRDIGRNHPDLLPRELLDDLQQVSRKVVKRLSNVSFKERELRRNQVLH
jgi:hypothetical protein